MLPEVVDSKGHSILGERFAQMLRVTSLEASGAQIAAEQRIEASRETFAEAVGYFHGISLFHTTLGGVDTYEHQRAFHKTTLGAEAATAIQADSRIENLLADFYAEFFRKAEKGGDGTIEIFVVVEVMDEFVVVRHGFLSRKGS